jgi:hypothetical protein
MIRIEGLYLPQNGFALGDKLLLKQVPSRAREGTVIAFVRVDGTFPPQKLTEASREAFDFLTLFLAIYSLSHLPIPQIIFGSTQSVKISPNQGLGYPDLDLLTKAGVYVKHPEERKEKFLVETVENFKHWEIISKEKKFSYLRSSLEFFFLGASERTIGASFVQIVTALEALFSDNDEITFKLAAKTALLIAENNHESYSILLDMKKFYRSRNNFVHGRSPEISGQDRYQLQHIAAKAIINSITLALSLNLDREKFNTFLEEALMSMPKRIELWNVIYGKHRPITAKFASEISEAWEN